MIATASPPPQQARALSERERIEELQQTVSASRLNLWQQCRLKFYFRYVLRITKPPTAALHVGTVVHAVLQAWNKARWRKEPFQVELFRSVFEESWVSEQTEKQIRWEENEEGLQRTQAWGLLAAYFIETPIKADERPEAVEVTMEADLARHGLPTLIGIMDLVRSGGRIVDFKTSGQTPNPEKVGHLHETQTACYAILYREATGKVEGGIELHHLVKLKTPKVVITCLEPMAEVQETRLFRIMESYQAGLERRDWIPSPNPMSCSCCEFFSECRRWR